MTLIKRLSPAERVLYDLGIDTPSLIDLDVIAYFLGAKIKYRPLDGCDARIVGYQNRAIISVNSKTTLNRQRFSIAHELGHWTYHKGKRLICNASENNVGKNKKNNFERSADLFAADLLIPSFLLSSVMKNVKWPSVKLIDEIARVFSVSHCCAAIRLVESDNWPMVLICNSSTGRSWFIRSKSVPEKWFPKKSLSSQSIAYDILNSSGARHDSFERTAADIWFEGHTARNYEVSENSFPSYGRQVLSLITITDSRMLRES